MEKACQALNLAQASELAQVRKNLARADAEVLPWRISTLYCDPGWSFIESPNDIEMHLGCGVEVWLSIHTVDDDCSNAVTFQCSAVVRRPFESDEKMVTLAGRPNYAEDGTELKVCFAPDSPWPLYRAELEHGSTDEEIYEFVQNHVWPIYADQCAKLIDQVKARNDRSNVTREPNGPWNYHDEEDEMPELVLADDFQLPPMRARPSPWQRVVKIIEQHSAELEETALMLCLSTMPRKYGMPAVALELLEMCGRLHVLFASRPHRWIAKPNPLGDYVVRARGFVDYATPFLTLVRAKRVAMFAGVGAFLLVRHYKK